MTISYLAAYLVTALAAVAMAVLVLALESQIAVAATLLVALLATIGLSRTEAGRAVGIALNESGPWVIFAICSGVIVVAAALHEEHFPLLMLATVLVYGIVCIGLTIQFGYAGVINFAAAAFFGVGGYVAAILGDAGIPTLIILLGAGVAAAAIGCILILPVLRTRGHYAALITIAFGLLFRSFLEVNQTLG